MAKPNDTSWEAEQVLTRVFRQMTPDQKWLLLGQAYRTAKTLHEAGVLARNPGASAREIHESWLKVTLGDQLFAAIGAKLREPNR